MLCFPLSKRLRFPVWRCVSPVGSVNRQPVEPARSGACRRAGRRVARACGVDQPLLVLLGRLQTGNQDIPAISVSGHHQHIQQAAGGGSRPGYWPGAPGRAGVDGLRLHSISIASFAINSKVCCRAQACAVSTCSGLNFGSNIARSALARLFVSSSLEAWLRM